ncbi:MAG: class I SAM-dependent methyltransferase [Gammaproteobacteria bacterium]|nr:class I SAM-dependent methyltransferase [Gammaproteobacteria bacterium]
MRSTFDKAYYDRFYRNPRTRVFTPAVARRQAEFIASYLKHLEIGVRSILDIGCGVGTILKTLQKQFPRARTEGVEASGYLCRRYGWVEGSVVDYRADCPFDLVVCNDVLGYLDDKTCTRALANLAELTASVLFLGVLSREDYEICDQNRTDPQQWMRPVAWYRRRLSRHFVNVGGGLFVKKPPNITIWHLDRLG